MGLENHYYALLPHINTKRKSMIILRRTDTVLRTIDQKQKENHSIHDLRTVQLKLMDCLESLDK